MKRKRQPQPGLPEGWRPARRTEDGGWIVLSPDGHYGQGATVEEAVAASHAKKEEWTEYLRRTRPEDRAQESTGPHTGDSHTSRYDP